jgi:serine/threonine-protein kinase
MAADPEPVPTPATLPAYTPPAAGAPTAVGPPPGADLPPSHVGRHRVEGEVGRGGMGAVYRAHDPDLNRPVAVKVLRADLADHPALARRFLEEARVGGRLQHPGVVPVYEVGRHDGRPYFTMKLVQGRTLAQLLKERPDPSAELPRFLLIFEQVCQAVGYAHSRGVLHRDLKPANVMVGEFGEVQVMDWGLAKLIGGGPPAGDAPVAHTARAADADQTVEGAVLGTPAYMAPEQALGLAASLDARCDVFALGGILCEILTGLPPYQGDTAEVLRRAAQADLADAHVRLAGCQADAELIALATACLSDERAGRPHDGGAVAAAAAAYRAGVEARLRAAELARAAAQTKVLEERKRRRLALALAAAVLLAVAAGGAAAWWRYEEQARAERAVEASLRQAADRRDRGEWPEALAELTHADGLLAGGGADQRRRAAALRADVETAAALEEVRQEEGVFRRGDAVDAPAYVDDAALDGRYAAVFRDYGIDPAALSPEEAAARVRASAVRGPLAAALDDWAACRQGDARAALLAVARLADADEGRDRVRAALAADDPDALAALADAPATADLPPQTQLLLGKALLRVKLADRAAVVLRRVQKQRPGEFAVYAPLEKALYLHKPPLADEAVRFATAATAARPRSPSAHLELGVALVLAGRPGEAVDAFAEAVRRRPDWAVARYDLGGALLRDGRPVDAVKHFQEAVRLGMNDGYVRHRLGVALGEAGRLPEALAALQEAARLLPDDAEVRFDLGVALAASNRGAEAVAAFEAALHIRPDYAEALFHLGTALRDGGRFADAVKALRRSHDLGSRAKEWKYPSAKALKECERLASLDARLPAVLKGDGRPADAAERAEFAFLCYQYRRRYATAAGWFAEAFAADPALADDLAAGHRYDAACAAVLASRGEGADALASATERARWRRQARDWLRADLAAWRTEAADPAHRAAARDKLKRWQGEGDLAGVREASELAQLPEEEQAEWKRLWDDVDALLKKVGDGN